MNISPKTMLLQWWAEDDLRKVDIHEVIRTYHLSCISMAHMDMIILIDYNTNNYIFIKNRFDDVKEKIFNLNTDPLFLGEI